MTFLHRYLAARTAEQSMARTRNVPVRGCHRLPPAPRCVRRVKSAEPPNAVAGFDPQVGHSIRAGAVKAEADKQ